MISCFSHMRMAEFNFWEKKFGERSLRRVKVMIRHWQRALFNPEIIPYYQDVSLLWFCFFICGDMSYWNKVPIHSELQERLLWNLVLVLPISGQYPSQPGFRRILMRIYYIYVSIIYELTLDFSYRTPVSPALLSPARFSLSRTGHLRVGTSPGILQIKGLGLANLEKQKLLEKGRES